MQIELSDFKFQWVDSSCFLKDRTYSSDKQVLNIDRDEYNQQQKQHDLINQQNLRLIQELSQSQQKSELQAHKIYNLSQKSHKILENFKKSKQLLSHLSLEKSDLKRTNRDLKQYLIKLQRRISEQEKQNQSSQEKHVEISFLKEQLSRTQREVNELISYNQELGLRIQEYEKLDLKYASLETELTTSLDKVTNNYYKIQDKFERFVKYAALYKKGYKKLSFKYRKIHKVLNGVQANYQSLKSEKSVLSDQLVQANHNIKNILESYEQLKTSNEKIASIEPRLKEYEDGLESIQNHYIVMIKKSEEQYTILESQLKKMDFSLNQLPELSEFNSLEEKLKVKFSKIENNLNKESTKLNHLSENYFEIEKELIAKQSSFALRTDEIDNQIKAYQADLNVVKDKLIQLPENNQLNNLFQKYKILEDDIQRELKSLKSELKNLTKINLQTSKRVDYEEDTLDTLIDEINLFTKSSTLDLDNLFHNQMSLTQKLEGQFLLLEKELDISHKSFQTLEEQYQNEFMSLRKEFFHHHKITNEKIDKLLSESSFFLNQYSLIDDDLAYTLDKYNLLEREVNQELEQLKLDFKEQETIRKEKIHQLNHQIDKLNHQYGKLDNSLNDLQENYSKIESEYHREMSKVRSDYNDRCSDLNKDYEKLDSQFNILETKYDDLLDSNQLKQSQLEDLIQSSSLFKNELSVINEQIINVEKALDSKQVNLSQYFQSIDENVVEIEKSYESLSNQYQLKIQQTEDSLKHFREKENEWLTKFSHLSEKYEYQSNLIKQLEDEIQTYKKSESNFNSKISEQSLRLNDEYQKQTLLTNQINHIVETYDFQLKTLQTELNSRDKNYHRILKELEANYGGFESEVFSMSTRFQDIINMLEKQITDSNNIQSKQELSIQSLKQELSSKLSKIQALSEHINSKDLHIYHQEKEFNKLQSKLEEKQTNIHSLKDEKVILYDKYIRLSEKYEALDLKKQELSQKNNLIAQKIELYQNLESQLEQEEKLNLELNRINKLNTIEIDSYKEKLVNIKSELIDVQQALSITKKDKLSIHDAFEKNKGKQLLKNIAYNEVYLKICEQLKSLNIHRLDVNSEINEMISEISNLNHNLEKYKSNASKNTLKNGDSFNSIDNSEIQLKYKSAQNKLKQLVAEVNALKENHSVKNQKLSQLNMNLISIASAKTDLEEELSLLKPGLLKTQSENNKLKAQIEIHEREVKTFSNQQKHFLRQINELKQNSEEDKLIIDRFDDKVRNLKTQLKLSEEEKVSYQDRVILLEKNFLETSEIFKENASIDDDKKTLYFDRLSANLKIDQLENQLNQLNSQWEIKLADVNDIIKLFEQFKVQQSNLEQEFQLLFFESSDCQKLFQNFAFNRAASESKQLLEWQKVQSEIDRVYQRYNEFQRRLGSQYSKSEDELENVQKHYDNLQQQLSVQYHHLFEDITALEKRFYSSLVQLDQQYFEVSKQLDTYELQLNRLQRKTKSSIETGQKAREKLSSELSQASQLYKQEQKNSHSLNSKLSTTQDLLVKKDKKLNELMSNIQGFKKDVVQLKSNLSKHKHNEIELNKKNQFLLDKKEALEKDKKDLKVQMNQFQKKLDQEMIRNKELLGTNIELEASKETLDLKLSNQSSLTEQNKLENKVLKEKYFSLKKELKSINAEKLQNSHEIKLLKEKLRNVQNSKNTLSAKSEHLEEQIEELSLKCEKYALEIEKIESESSPDSQLQTNQKNYDNLNTHLKVALEESDNYKSRIIELERALLKSEKESNIDSDRFEELIQTPIIQLKSFAELMYTGENWSENEKQLLNFVAEHLDLKQEHITKVEQDLKSGMTPLISILDKWDEVQKNPQINETKLSQTSIVKDEISSADPAVLDKEKSIDIKEPELTQIEPTVPVPQNELEKLLLDMVNKKEKSPVKPTTISSQKIESKVIQKSEIIVPQVDLEQIALPPAPGMVFIPGGKYLIGDNTYSNARPIHLVTLKPFFIDIFPVTNADFEEFILEGGYYKEDFWSEEGWDYIQKENIEQPAFWNKTGYKCGIEYPEYPVIGVGYFEALAYSSWSNKRLPSEIEWEAASRGPNGWDWPWGNEWIDNRANTGELRLMNISPISQYPEGKSFYGCQDMIGNVLEWTSSIFKPYPYDSNDGREQIINNANRTIKGCSWSFQGMLTRCAYRFYNSPFTRLSDVGFRCARSV